MPIRYDGSVTASCTATYEECKEYRECIAQYLAHSDSIQASICTSSPLEYDQRVRYRWKGVTSYPSYEDEKAVMNSAGSTRGNR